MASHSEPPHVFVMKKAERFCKVCFDAGCSKDEYTSHFVREGLNGDAKTCCPILLANKCVYCHKKGHTRKYCKKLAAFTGKTPYSKRVAGPISNTPFTLETFTDASFNTFSAPADEKNPWITVGEKSEKKKPSITFPPSFVLPKEHASKAKLSSGDFPSLGKQADTIPCVPALSWSAKIKKTKEKNDAMTRELQEARAEMASLRLLLAKCQQRKPVPTSKLAPTPVATPTPAPTSKPTTTTLLSIDDDDVAWGDLVMMKNGC